MPSRGADLFGLAGAGRPGANHFLERDDVRVQAADHFRDAGRHRPPIHAAAAVDVIRGDPDIDVPARRPRICGFHDHCGAAPPDAAGMRVRLTTRLPVPRRVSGTPEALNRRSTSGR